MTSEQPDREFVAGHRYGTCKLTNQLINPEEDFIFDVNEVREADNTLIVTVVYPKGNEGYQDELELDRYQEMLESQSAFGHIER